MNKKSKRGIYATVVLSVLLVFSILGGCWASAKSNVENLLSKANLSPLPNSATNVEYYQWNGLFTGETYAKFELSASDLGAFISNSPALRGIKPRVYDATHHHLPYPATTTNVSGMSLENDYFHQHPKYPIWFDLTVHGNGRKYVIPWGPDMMILIDNDRRIVWLTLVKG